MVLNYMPFAQPSLLRLLFRIPIKYRKNGNMYREIIKRYRPSLVKHPLVKNNVLIPFFFPSLAAMPLSKVKRWFNRSFEDRSPDLILLSMKEFLHDLIASRETKEYHAYDYPKVLAIIEKYYGGDRGLANRVLWWLTFELWRRNVER